jgi:phosphatidylglycerophosphatase A
MKRGLPADRHGIDPWVALGTCGGIGRIPVAPGTFGSLVGLPLSLATGAAATRLAGVAGLSGAGAIAAVEAALLAAVFAAGVMICGRAASALGLGKDPGPVVFDEVAAVPVALLAVAPAARSIGVLAVAFLLFRLADIAKPFPCRWLERLPGGLGIMADDLAAAGYAALGLGVIRAIAGSQPWL